MAFTFRYETLLSYRQHIKEKAEIELSRARGQLKQARDLLEYYVESLQQAKKSLESDLKTSISSDEIGNHTDYLSGLKGNIGVQKLKVAEVKKEVRKKMEDLLTKAKQFKVIEKLKERDLQKWSHQQLQMEQKRLNEVAVIRHGREFL